jgi:hypothetical protein
MNPTGPTGATGPELPPQPLPTGPPTPDVPPGQVPGEPPHSMKTSFWSKVVSWLRSLFR